MCRVIFGLVVLLFASSADAQSAPELLKVQSVASNTKLTAGRLSFELYGADLVFVANRSAIEDPKALFKILTESEGATDSLTVWYDPETAYIDRDTSAPSVVVRSVEYQGKTYVADKKTPPRTLKQDERPAEIATFDLARGIAYAGGSQLDKSLELLDQAIAAPAFPQGLSTLAYTTRADVRRNVSIMEIEPGERRDRLMIGALEDDRKVRAALPVLSGPAYNVAHDWKILGAYREALAAYHEAFQRWPEQQRAALIGLTTAYRTMGQYEDALHWSDVWGALPDAKDTMPYRYHRGWILNLMGRYDEAASELTEGMKHQTDFVGAYWLRTCAYAATGRIQEALADNERALALQQEEMRQAPPSRYRIFMVQRFAQVNDTLKKALTDAPHQNLPGQCEGFWDWGDTYRTRSKLLPQ